MQKSSSTVRITGGRTSLLISKVIHVKKKKKKFLGTTVYNVQTLDQEQCSRAKTMCLCTQTPASSTMPDTQQGLGTRVLN